MKLSMSLSISLLVARVTRVRSGVPTVQHERAAIQRRNTNIKRVVGTSAVGSETQWGMAERVSKSASETKRSNGSADAFRSSESRPTKLAKQ
eukprot:5011989-Pyramimonas_sp.AAC.4